MATAFRTGPVKRATIWVRDIGRSLALYRDVLGLEVVERKEISGPQLAGMVGYADARLSIAHLGAGSDHGWIGLYELSGTTPAADPLPPPPPDRLVPGQVAIVLETTEMEAIAAELDRQGYRFLLRPFVYVKETSSPEMPAGRYGETIFYDPDGVPVSLMQYAPL